MLLLTSLFLMDLSNKDKMDRIFYQKKTLFKQLIPNRQIKIKNIKTILNMVNPSN